MVHRNLLIRSAGSAGAFFVRIHRPQQGAHPTLSRGAIRSTTLTRRGQNGPHPQVFCFTTGAVTTRRSRYLHKYHATIVRRTWHQAQTDSRRLLDTIYIITIVMHRNAHFCTRSRGLDPMFIHATILASSFLRTPSCLGYRC